MTKSPRFSNTPGARRTTIVRTTGGKKVNAPRTTLRAYHRRIIYYNGFAFREYHYYYYYYNILFSASGREMGLEQTGISTRSEPFSRPPQLRTRTRRGVSIGYFIIIRNNHARARAHTPIAGAASGFAFLRRTSMYIYVCV